MLETFEKKISKNYESCVVEIPKGFALANGFPEKCFVSLTMRNGKLNSEIVEYNDKTRKMLTNLLAIFPTFNEELKRLGD
jgi:hypothetical protein